jgi:hypothetical protein
MSVTQHTNEHKLYETNRRHRRLPVESLKKEAMRTAEHAKKVYNMELTVLHFSVTVVLYRQLWFH